MSDMTTTLWTEALQLFTTRNLARAMDLEIIAEDIGAQSEVRGMPLRGVAYDYHGDAVEIMLGGKSNHHITHNIEHVRSVDMFTADLPMHDVLRVSYEGGAAILTASPVELTSDVCATAVVTL